MNDRSLFACFPSLAGCLLLLAATNGVAQNPAPVACTNAAVQATTPSSEFTILGDAGVVRHEATGLEWQRCSIGQRWDGVTCQDSATEHTWQQALEIAADAGDAWRLPNIQELRSLVERCRENPAINRQIFPNTPSSNFWSTSTNIEFGDRARVVFFRSGIDRRFFKTLEFRVRLVRDAQ